MVIPTNSASLCLRYYILIGNSSVHVHMLIDVSVLAEFLSLTKRSLHVIHMYGHFLM